MPARVVLSGGRVSVYVNGDVYVIELDELYEVAYGTHPVLRLQLLNKAYPRVREMLVHLAYNLVSLSAHVEGDIVTVEPRELYDALWRLRTYEARQIYVAALTGGRLVPPVRGAKELPEPETWLEAYELFVEHGYEDAASLLFPGDGLAVAGLPPGTYEFLRVGRRSVTVLWGKYGKSRIIVKRRDDRALLNVEFVGNSRAGVLASPERLDGIIARSLALAQQAAS